MCKTKCSCDTPNTLSWGDSVNKNGYTCTADDATGVSQRWCAIDQGCLGTGTFFLGEEGPNEGCQTTCWCENPNGGTVNQNGFKCSDGSHQWVCGETQQCGTTQHW